MRILLTILFILSCSQTSFTNPVQDSTSSLTRIGFVSSMLVGLVLQGSADARAHTPRHEWPEMSIFAKDDLFYLGVRNGSFLAGASIAALGNYSKDRQRFVKDVGAVILIGSALFDIAYSYEMTGKPVMDLKSWYRIGKHNVPISKKTMIVFNITRLAAGIYLLAK